MAKAHCQFNHSLLFPKTQVILSQKSKRTHSPVELGAGMFQKILIQWCLVTIGKPERWMQLQLHVVKRRGYLRNVILTMNYNLTSMYSISPSVIPGSLFPALHMCSQSQIQGSITVVVSYFSAHLLLLTFLLAIFISILFILMHTHSLS